MKAQFLPLFNVNLSQPQLKSTSTQFQLNFDSTSSQPQPQPQPNLNSTSTLTSTQPQFQPQFQPQLNLNLNLNLNSTSTQYGCDIKATQSCCSFNFRLCDEWWTILIWRVERIWFWRYEWICRTVDKVLEDKIVQIKLDEITKSVMFFYEWILSPQ